MTAETYAYALVQTTRGKDAGAVADDVDRLNAILKRNGHERLLPRILAAVERILAHEERNTRIEFTAARKEDLARFAPKIFEYRAQLDAGEGVGVAERVDDTLIGGFRFRSKSARIDATYKRELLELYRALAATSH